MKIEFKNNCIYVNGEETEDAELIGKAVIENQKLANIKIREFANNTTEMLRMVNLSKEYDLLWSWRIDNFKDVKMPCLRRANLPFYPNYHQTQLLADLLTALKEEILILNTSK